MSNEIMVIPEEYLKKSKEELRGTAKKLYDSAVSGLYYNKEFNPDFEADKSTIKMLIDSYIYAMCCSDGSVNQSELDFMTFLNSDMHSKEWQAAMPHQLTKDETEFLTSISISDAFDPGIARNIIRTALIAAVIDTSSVNAEENDALLDLLSYVGF